MISKDNEHQMHGSAEKNPDFQNLLPTAFNEIDQHAAKSKELIITSPIALLQFINTVEEAQFIAANSGNSEHSNVLSAYLNALNKQLLQFDWSPLVRTQFSEPELDAFIKMLRKLEQFSTDKIGQRLKKTVEIILRGIAEKRFNDGENQYWSSALAFLYSLTSYAARNVEDLTVSETVVDLYTGEFGAVADRGSILWLSPFLAIHAAHPDMEQLYAIGVYANLALGFMTELTGKHEQFHASNHAYDPYLLQFSTIASIIKANPELAASAAHLPEITELMRETLKANISNESVQDHFNLTAAQMRQTRRMNVQPALMRTAIASGMYPDRLQNIYDYKERRHLTEDIDARQTVKTPTATIFTAPIDEITLHEFPYYYSLALPDEFKALRQLARKDVLFQLLEQNARHKKKEKEAETGRTWHMHPFALRGISGYAIIDEQYQVLASPQQVSRFMDKLLADQNVFEEIELHSDFLENTESLAFEREYPGVVLRLTSSEFQPKTQLEALIDYSLPEQLRLQGLDLLRENASLRRDIVRSFRQGLTEAGDLYYLADHPQIPGLIYSAHLEYHPRQGFLFTFTLVEQPDLFPTIENPQVKLHLSFSSAIATIDFLADASEFPRDVKTVFESIALALFKNSCTGEIPEIDWEERLKSEGSIPNRQKPHLKHVPLKQDGSPGNFSEEAERAFQSMLQQMGLGPALKKWLAEFIEVSGGISLAEINRMHHQDNPDCNRNITFSRGYESEELKDHPLVLQPPDELFLGK